MAWIKVELETPDKPEVIGIANAVGIDQDAVVGKLVRLWCWADKHTVDGNAPSVTEAFIDRHTFVTGFAAAMAKVGWLEKSGDGVCFPNFDRHNGQTAKQRGLTAKRVADCRKKSNAASVTPALPKAQPEGEGEEERDLSSRKEPIGGNRSSRSTGKVSKRGEPKIDLSHLTDVDWATVGMLAEKAAKRIPPLSTDDRRAWLKYALMAHTTFSEHWLLDAAEGAVQTEDVKSTRQAIFVTALKRGAKEKHDTDEGIFAGMFKRIEIPTGVWNSNIVAVKGANRGK